MRFTITDEAIDRLGITEAARGVEFDGPTLREGLIGGFDGTTRKWIKARLKVDRLDTLDLVDARIVYYLVSVRRTNHTWLPIERIDELALSDFEMTRHKVTQLDQDGDCGECAQNVHAKVHIPADDDDPEVPPTTGPGGPETTATAT